MPRVAALGDIMHNAILRHAGHSALKKLRRNDRRRKKKDRSEAHDAALDQVKLLTVVVGAVADGPLNVPLLKGVCALAEKMVDIAQTVRANRDDCYALAEQICAHLDLIGRTYHPDFRPGALLADKERPRLDEHVMLVHRTLEDVLSEVEQLVSRSKWRRTVFHESDKRKIASCQGRLQHTFTQFQMGVAISTSLDIHSVRADVVKLKTLANTSLVHSSRILRYQTMMMVLLGGLFELSVETVVVDWSRGVVEGARVPVR